MATYSDLTVANATIGYAFSIEGCPYVFVTHGITSVNQTGGKPDEDWCVPTVEWTVIAALASTGFEWTERVTPPTAETDVSAPKIIIRDITAGSGLANGYPIGTWLISRHDAATSTALDATLTDTSTATIDVFDSSSFVNDQVVWIDREAILTDNIISAQKLDIAASGRGVYGSKARYHIVDEPNNYRPRVFASWPGCDGRRCVLWKGIDVNGVLTDPVPIWRGTVQGSSIARGGDVELTVEHALKKAARTRVGIAGSAMQLQGFTSTVAPLVYAVFERTVGGTYSRTFVELDIGTYPDGPSLVAQLSRESNLAVTSLGHISFTYSLGSIIGRWQSVTGATSATLRIGSQVLSTFAFQGRDGPAPVSTPAVNYEFPPVLQEASAHRATALRFNSVSSLSSGVGSYTGTTGYRYTARQVLSATSDKYKLLLVPQPDDIAGGTVVNTTNRTFKGVLEIYDSNNRRHTEFSLDIPGLWGGGFGGLLGSNYYFTSPFVFRVTLDVRCDEWLDGLRSVVISDPALAATTSAIDVDPRDWASSTYGVGEQTSIDDRIRALTPGPFRARRWLFDGTANLLDLWTTNLQIVGGALTLRRSRISPNVFQVPLQSDVYDAAHNVTRAEMLAGMPDGWQRSPELIANVISVSVGEENATTKLVVRDQTSAAKYGDGAEIAIEVRGIEFPDEVRANGIEALRRHITTRMTLWSNPWETITIAVPLTYIDTIFLLDRIKLAPYVSPDGTGYRSGATSTTRTGIVIERAIKKSHMVLSVVCPSTSRVSGFAPCIRVDSISSATITAKTGYITNATSGMSDYAGSNLSTYASEYGSFGTGCVANDGGVGFFVAGDRCELILRDNTTATTESVIVQSVNPATKEIVLTGAPVGVWSPGSTTVDLKYDDYGTSGLQAGQKLYVYVGARSSGKIASTSDRNWEWSA